MSRSATRANPTALARLDGEEQKPPYLVTPICKVDNCETLVVSPYTVEDRVKNLYEKLGVASRQELVARVFLDE